MKNQYAAKLNVIVARDWIPVFFSLLRHGFMVETQVGCSIKTMLSNAFGLDDNYVEDRIKTIFLDAKPVDDISTACINDGSVLALSGAMPGLAGATLRRGGRLASFRETISCRSDGKNASRQDGHIFVKLFNLMVKDLGPIFLKKGILIKKEQLEDFFRRQPDDFWLSLKSAYLNGQKISLDKWPEIDLPDMILLSAEPEIRS
ncbi:MAG: hypothetical protein KJP23_22480 [Deltaproteobacteria bacterium]|nr:hypothetical protein [Deltaproteobacteria bacterium]